MKSKCDALRQIAAAIEPITRLPLDVHQWWGRRYHELTRGMIISALASPVEDIGRLAASATDFSGAIVLDPFVGSGTTIIEALRLGCFPIGIDLNPMAWWIMRNRLLRVDVAALDEAVEAIFKVCFAETGHLYQTTCPQCSADVPAKTYIWAWVSQCAKCGQEVRVLRSAQLVAKRDLHVFVCPACGEVVPTREQEKVECPSCQRVLSKKISSYKRGTVICPYCGNIQSLIDEINRAGQKLSHEMLMLEMLCPEDGHLFKAPEQADLALVEQAKSLFADRGDELPLPDLSLDFDFSPTNVQRYGYRRYTDFFSERQLFTLGVLLKAITALESDEIQSTLLTLFSGLLEYNSVLCYYDSRRSSVRSIYARHTLSPVPLSAEGNPWHERNIGGWKSRYRRLIRPAKEQLLADPNSLVSGREVGWPRVIFASDFSELQEGCVLLQCTSASDFPLPVSSVDAIVTDPPYFDSIQYAFLSDFYYAWLQPVLADKHGAFSSPATPKSAEIVVHPPSDYSKNRKEQVELYENNLKRAFSEFGRVLKPDAPLVYIYHVPSLDSFKSTLQWTLDAGFYVADFCPIDQSRGRAFRQSVRDRTFNVDAIFYCYKRGAGRPMTWESFQRDLTRHLDWALRELEDPSHEQTIETVWGEFVRRFSLSYPNIYRADGHQVSVAEAVDWMLSLASVVYGRVDITKMAETQAIRSWVSSGHRSEDELDGATNRIAELVEESVSKSEVDQIEQSLRAQLGAELWGRLEPRTRKFLVTAECHYQASMGRDIDFGPTAVAFTKPLETELRLKFCRHLAQYAQAQHLDRQRLKAGKKGLKWEHLAAGEVTLGSIEHLLRNVDEPVNLAAAKYLSTLPPPTASYTRSELPDVIEEFRENGRNGGAHIDPVDQEVVEQLRSKVLDRDAHLRYWVEM